MDSDATVRQLDELMAFVVQCPARYPHPPNHIPILG